MPSHQEMKSEISLILCPCASEDLLAFDFPDLSMPSMLSYTQGYQIKCYVAAHAGKHSHFTTEDTNDDVWDRNEVVICDSLS